MAKVVRTFLRQRDSDIVKATEDSTDSSHSSGAPAMLKETPSKMAKEQQRNPSLNVLSTGEDQGLQGSMCTVDTVESSFRSFQINEESSSFLLKEPSDEEEEGESLRSMPARGGCFLLPEEGLIDDDGDEQDVGPGNKLANRSSSHDWDQPLQDDFEVEAEDPALLWRKKQEAEQLERRRQMGFEAQSHIELLGDIFDNNDVESSPNEPDAAEFSPTAARKAFMRRDAFNHQAQLFSLELDDGVLAEDDEEELGGGGFPDVETSW
eukprot:CAMPEP_0172448758 /NCGR_PEP_ID=MMETSP1065-20121228/7710_1 /TAXON_ID=265537 /ORGANISM="Amphiprora paludosa, Strain CCMP125" /LENGTH=264 /DNA_ID=CAMNT_0013200343 /DNA_START=153 /DNA_END=950 /DNA_ORIENTATION=+